MPSTDAGFTDSAAASGQRQLIQLGPTLSVEIGFDPTFRPALGRRPGLPNSLYHALVDTGATESCIDSELAGILALPVVDQRGIAGVQGASTANVHLAQIHVPELQLTVYGRFSGVHLAAGGQPHKALLGRTFLRNCVMTYDGRTGSVTISND